MGFFEIYGKVGSETFISLRQIRRLFFQAHGQMNFPGITTLEDVDNLFIERGQLLTFNEYEGTMFNKLFKNRVQQMCPHRNELTKPACLNFLDYLADFHYDFYIRGPLYLLMAHIPDGDFLMILFPFRKAKLRERLDTLLLQSRSWGLKSLASSDIFPNSVANIVKSSANMARTANSWAKSVISPDITDLELSDEIYELCSVALNKSPTQDSADSFNHMLDQHSLWKELKAIDLWLNQMEPQVLCRKLTLSIIGDGIQQIVNTVQQQPIPEAASHAENATALSSCSGLEGKLVCFLKGIEKPACFDYLHAVDRRHSILPSWEVIEDTSEGLKKIRDVWQRRKRPLEGEFGGNEDNPDGSKEHKSRAWKIPDATHRPLDALDDVLIYHAVLITLLYSTGCDSSALISQDLGLIVPIL